MVARRDRVLSQMRRGTLEFCVLALLRDGEQYGFELVKALSAVDGMVTSDGTIYPLFSRLRRDGLDTTSWVECSRRPPRRYYRLTAAGARALTAASDEWQRFRDSVDRFLEEGLER